MLHKWAWVTFCYMHYPYTPLLRRSLPVSVPKANGHSLPRCELAPTRVILILMASDPLSSSNMPEQAINKASGLQLIVSTTLHTSQQETARLIHLPPFREVLYSPR